MPEIFSDLLKPQPEKELAEELTAQNVKVIANLERAAESERCLTDKIAGFITRFCESMAFVWVHVGWFGGWILWNTVAPVRHIDPFQFNFIMFVLSLEAIFLSTFILISGNREGRINERRSRLDLKLSASGSYLFLYLLLREL